MVEQYVKRVHTEPAVLNIGQDTGALVIYTREDLLEKEIEVSLKGNDAKRIHTAIHERKVNGRSFFAGLFLALPAGDYIIWVHPSSEVSICGGQVAEVNWRDREIYVPAIGHRHPFGMYDDFSAFGASPSDNVRGLLPPR